MPLAVRILWTDLVSGLTQAASWVSKVVKPARKVSMSDRSATPRIGTPTWLYRLKYFLFRRELGQRRRIWGMLDQCL